MAVPAHAATARTSHADAGTPISVSALAWSDPQIDATSGTTNTVTFTIDDSNAAAGDLYGDVALRKQGATPGTYLGLALDVPFDMNNEDYGTAQFVSGTAQSATFTYTYAVPRYAATTSATWTVATLTASDYQQDHLTETASGLSGFADSFTATELVDSTPPQYSDVTYSPNTLNQDQPYVYVGDSSTTAPYTLAIHDSDSGFWKGSLTLANADGETLKSTFAETVDTYSEASCGGLSSGDDFNALCAASVDLPEGLPYGTWVVSSITLWDNAGNHQTYSHLDAQPIQVTSNTVVSATALSAPSTLDTWTQSQTFQLSMNVLGAQQGVSAIYADFNGVEGSCEQLSTTPTENADGTYSVPVRMDVNSADCPLTGLVVVDGAGDVAVYGSDFAAPDTGVDIKETPDTSPPVLDSVSLDPTSISLSQTDGGQAAVTLHVTTQVAPVDSLDITLYDAQGDVVDESGGGAAEGPNGEVDEPVSLPYNITPGTYTIGLVLTDAGDLSSSYGTPDGLPMPGGPLTLTVTS